MCGQPTLTSASGVVTYLRLDEKFHTRACTCTGSIDKTRRKLMRSSVLPCPFFFKDFLRIRQRLVPDVIKKKTESDSTNVAILLHLHGIRGLAFGLVDDVMDVIGTERPSSTDYCQS